MIDLDLPGAPGRLIRLVRYQSACPYVAICCRYMSSTTKQSMRITIALIIARSVGFVLYGYRADAIWVRIGHVGRMAVPAHGLVTRSDLMVESHEVAIDRAFDRDRVRP